MFEVVSRGFRSARLALQGKAELTDAALEPALREVRASLLEADVGVSVVADFLERVRVRSLGEIVPIKGPGGTDLRVTPQDWFIKACYDELVELMGPSGRALRLDGKPTVILLVGLQGSGKTTTAGKLARWLASQGRKPLLVAADVHRPAAADQLVVLGRRIQVPVFSIKGMNALQLATMGVAQARNVGRDVVIIDTAGRLAIDGPLMEEVRSIRNAVDPHETLFVTDAMIGQDAVATAAEFDRQLDFTGFVMTKLDGDARGGAALSIKAVTGKPILVLGQGESLDKLEAFRPEGLAQRILGFGDVVGLMADFEKHVDPKQAENDAEKMLRGDFSYDDFVGQLRTIKKMGSIRDLLGRLPGMSQLVEQAGAALDDGELDRVMTVVDSMTPQERHRPDVLNPGRMVRIARGCGRSVQNVQELHKRFLDARKMMREMGGLMKDPSKMLKLQQQMARGIPPGAAAAEAPRAIMGKDEKEARRKKAKDARKARKKNRR